MLALKYLLMTVGWGMMFAALCVLAYDLYLEISYRRSTGTPVGTFSQGAFRWRTALALAMLGWLPLLIAFSIVVVPSGTAGVRVS
jgi:hypothetical protein